MIVHQHQPLFHRHCHCHHHRHRHRWCLVSGVSASSASWDRLAPFRAFRAFRARASDKSIGGSASARTRRDAPANTVSGGLWWSLAVPGAHPHRLWRARRVWAAAGWNLRGGSSRGLREESGDEAEMNGRKTKENRVVIWAESERSEWLDLQDIVQVS
jgi:hypothetical protein